jgi:hypothetical protein
VIQAIRASIAGRIAMLSVVSWALWPAGALTQDPVKILPDSYRLDFENDLVKVVHVLYPAHAKLSAHDHPRGPTAYVYLTDSGPILFTHIGLTYGTIERPATMAGAVRLARAVDEIHEVENPNDSPSEFLRVEFKKMPPGGLRGRFFAEAHPAGENFSKKHFENDHLRMTRLACATDIACDLSPAAGEPALIVALRPARLEAVAGGQARRLDQGRTLWLEAGTPRVFRNKEPQPAELLVFAFKAAPR